MFKVKVLSVGKCKETWLLSALAEYEKRLRGKIEIEWVFVQTDAELVKKCAIEPFLIALDLKGKLLSSEELSVHLFLSWGSRPAFAIGGAEGLPQEIIQRAAFRWCLSPLTFTHQIVRLLLAEQLYRAVEIERGSSYHK